MHFSMKGSDHYTWNTYRRDSQAPWNLPESISEGFLSAITLKNLKSTNSILAHKHPSPSPSATKLVLPSTLYFSSFPEANCSFILNILIMPRGIPLTFNIFPFYSWLTETFPEDTISHVAISTGRHSFSQISLIPELFSEKTLSLAFQQHFQADTQS